MASKEIQELKERLQKIADKRTAEAEKKAKAQVAAQDKAHPYIKYEADNMKRWSQSLIFAYCHGVDILYHPSQDDWDDLASVLTYIECVEYIHWRPAPRLDPSLPDELNLFKGVGFIDSTVRKEFGEFIKEFDGAINVLGVLAKNLKSAILPQMVECLMRYRRYRSDFQVFSTEEARQFVGKLSHVERYLAAELSLYNDEEKKLIYPPEPCKHDLDTSDFDVDTKGKTTEELVEEARARAKKKYREIAWKILPRNMNSHDPKLPKVILDPLETLTSWADRLGGEFPHHRRDKVLPLDLGPFMIELGDLLKTDTILRYGVPKDVVDERLGYKTRKLDPYFTDETPEHPRRVHIVECLLRYLKDGLQIAGKLNSESLPFFKRMNEIYEDHQVEKVGFYFSDTDERHMRDLAEFTKLLVDSHRKIWGDIEAHGGKFRLGKAPGRPAASLGKGPQTSVKEAQRKAICREALQHPFGLTRAKADDKFISNVWQKVGGKPGGYATKGAFARWFKGATIDKIKQYK